jgi:hypothetical protein
VQGWMVFALPYFGHCHLSCEAVMLEGKAVILQT